MKNNKMVAGLMFSHDNHSVALIEKKRPPWQRGKLNGIGGHIEKIETPHEAMVREFKEEAGAYVTVWRPFCILNGTDWTVYWFTSNVPCDISSTTDEKIGWYWVDDVLLGKYQCIQNLKWLIPLALDKDGVTGLMTDNS